jgi:glycosyltransferase involved in cell wall biosynthesis
VLPFYPEMCASEPLRSRVRLALLAWATRHFVRRAEGTIFLSRAGREDVLSRSSVKPRDERVIPHGVDPGFGRMDAVQARAEVARRFGLDAPYVLYASHLYRYKRVESLIEAMAVAGPALRARSLAIAGAPYDAAYAAELAVRVRDRGVEGRVKFLGSVDYAALSVLHAGADALAFLSVCENCPNLVLEALNAGGPLVLANRPILSELAGEAALYVDPERPQDVAAAFERLLTDAGLRDDLRERARARARSFSWDDAAAGTLAFLERVGGARSARAA